MKEIALIGLSQSLFFIILLFLKKGKQLKDYLLIALFLCVALELFFRSLLYSDIQYNKSKLIVLDIIYWALFGPVLLFYTFSVINKGFLFKFKHLFHLTPLLISLITISVYLFNFNSYNSFSHFYNTSKGFGKIGLMSWEFTTPLYFLYILIILTHHKSKVRNVYSIVEKKELRWLFLITLGLMIFVYVSDLLWFFTDIFPVSESIKIMTLLLTAFVFILGIYGYKQENIFDGHNIEPERSNASGVKQKKYQKSILEPNERQEIIQKLTFVMQNEKPYMNSEISINDLAELMGVSVYKLSRVINENYNRNFFDFINNFRINEAKQLLTSSRTCDSKIESIAYDCGFNSKSSFYSIFKKHTHLTPTEFKGKFLANEQVC